MNIYFTRLPYTLFYVQNQQISIEIYLPEPCASTNSNLLSPREWCMKYRITMLQ